MGSRESDIHSTRPREPLIVSVGKALRDQPVQEWERSFKTRAKAQ